MNAEDKLGRNVLFYAVMSGNVFLLRRLLLEPRITGLNQRDSDETYLLTFAQNLQNFEAVKAIIEHSDICPEHVNLFINIQVEPYQ